MSGDDSSSDYLPESECGGSTDGEEDWMDDQSTEEAEAEESVEAPAAESSVKWQSENEGLRNIPFVGTTGLNVPLPAENRPIDYFYMLYDEGLLESIVNNTNKCAEELFLHPETSASARITRWKTLTVEELKAFLALVIHTGVIRLDHLQDYWKVDALFNIPVFKEHVSRDRFLLILRCLSFSSSTSLDDKGFGRAAELVDFFNKKMGRVYSPSRELCVDEPAYLSKGRIFCGKDHESGKECLKLFSLCEPQGLTVSFAMSSAVQGGRSRWKAKWPAEKVVQELTRNYLNKGHSLYTASSFTTVSVASQLLSQDTYCTGIINPEVEKSLPSALKNANLTKGKSATRYANGIVVGKWNWKRKRKLLYLSTEHENDMVSIMNHFGDVGGKPLPVIKYNATMKAVNRAEQLMSLYPCQTTTLGWYKKIFFHVLQIMTINSWFLYNTANPDKKISLYDHRLLIIKALLPQAQPPPRPVVTKNQEHVLAITDKRDNTGRRKLRRCRVCAKKGLRKETVYCCAACPEQPGLCPVGCFNQHHMDM